MRNIFENNLLQRSVEGGWLFYLLALFWNNFYKSLERTCVLFYYFERKKDFIKLFKKIIIFPISVGKIVTFCFTLIRCHGYTHPRQWKVSCSNRWFMSSCQKLFKYRLLNSRADTWFEPQSINFFFQDIIQQEMKGVYVDVDGRN